MRISNVRVSYSTDYLREQVGEAIEILKRRKRNTTGFVCGTLTAVIISMIVFIILTHDVSGSVCIGFVILLIIWGIYFACSMATCASESTCATEIADYIKVTDSYGLEELMELQELTGVSWLKAFLETDVAENVINNTELAIAVLKSTPINIEAEVTDEDEVTLWVNTTYSSMSLEVDECYFNINKYKGDGSDLTLVITDEDLVLCKGDVELKPVKYQVD